ncbi:DEAD/DEAH box helicase [Pseudomonas sp. NPDC088368]|uniref:DEAD/DEAH box helicase n=1 Tax=Pseudomonas sp. NPDC088368 TaxID=3364453 RepID=UPI0037FDDB16
MAQPRLMNRRPALLRKVVFDGYDFGLSLSYVEGANRLLLRRGGFFIRRADHPLVQFWRVPATKLLDDLDVLFSELVELADGKFTESWPTFREKIEKAQGEVDRSAFVWGMKLRLAPLVEGGVLLSGDFHPGSVAVSKRMRGTYLTASRSWRIHASPEVVRSNLILEIGMTEDQFELLDTLQELLSDGSIAQASDVVRMQLGGQAPEAGPKSESNDGEADVYLASIPSIRLTELTEEFIDHALQQHSLMEHQPAGIRHLLQRTSALLADDMGLGKTRQAIIAAAIRAQGKPILVIVLTSLIINWQREIQTVFPDALIALQKHDPGCQWVIVNYERLGDFVQFGSHFAVMIVDEAHRLKEPTAAWTRHGFDIAANVPNRYLLTGTPVLNRESELHTLLRLSGHPIGQLPLREFCERFAGNPDFRQTLRSQISDWMMRRRKDVLPNLKGKQRQTVSVVLTTDERKEYNEILRSDRHTFARLGALRQMLERIKVRVIVDLISELDVEDKAILFCEHKETVFELDDRLSAAGLECVTLVGSDTPKKRQKSIDRFQQDPDVRFFIGTTSAAGTGNNLTAANYVFFLGLPWTPGLQDQAEDRAFRNGQLRAVFVKIPLVEDSIDQQLWQMLQSKRSLAQDLIEPDPIAASREALAAII